MVSAALALLWLHVLSQPSPEVTSEYRLGVWVTAAMVVMETVVQPLAILAQAMLFVKLKVREVIEWWGYFVQSGGIGQ